jgi:hypothetical protein
VNNIKLQNPGSDSEKITVFIVGVSRKSIVMSRFTLIALILDTHFTSYSTDKHCGGCLRTAPSTPNDSIAAAGATCHVF